MTDHAASRRAFLGAAATGAGVAAFSALSLDRAMADSAPAPSATGLGGTTASATPLGAMQPLGLPPTIPGTLTKTFIFSDAQGFNVGAPAPLAWYNGAYQPAEGFLDLALGLEAGATIKRIDLYAERMGTGTASVILYKAALGSSAGGQNIDTITTASGDALITGGKAFTLVVGAGEQYYIESGSFSSTNVTLVGLIVTYFPATPQLHLLHAPVRVYDSRPSTLPAVGPKTPLTGGTTRAIDCTTASAVPTGAKAALVNVTAAHTSAGGFIALFKNGIAWPGNSSLNWDHASEVIATTTVVALDPNAKLAAYAEGSADVIFDVIGFYA